MPSVYKLGKTTRTPDERSIELFTTGVPTPFDIEISFVVSDCDYSERKIFEILEKYRISNRREFFKGISIKDIIRLILPALRNFEVHSQKSDFDVGEIRNQIEIKRERINREQKEREEKKDRAENNIKKFIDAHYKSDYTPYIEIKNVRFKYHDEVLGTAPLTFSRILRGFKQFEKSEWIEKKYKNDHKIREGYHSLIEEIFLKSRRARHFYFMLHRKHEEEYEDVDKSTWSSEWDDYVGHDLWQKANIGGGDIGILCQINKALPEFRACNDLLEWEFLSAVVQGLYEVNWEKSLRILRLNEDLQKIMRKYRNEKPPEEILEKIHFYSYPREI